LRRGGAIDFDDMLSLAVRLLRARQPIRTGLTNRFRWIFVDEYQDTNAVQARLLSLPEGRGRT